MPYQLRKRRRSTRLPDYHYRGPGAYFVTICTYERGIIFDDPAVRRAVELALFSIGRYCRPASVDEFVVMPNHLHAIIRIASKRDVGAQHTGQRNAIPPADDVGLCEGVPRATCAAPLRAPPPRVQSGSLGAVVRAFKSASAKRVNAIRDTPGARVWQRNYYEHVIRDENDLRRIRQYIRDNPAKWAEDPENPVNTTRM